MEDNAARLDWLEPMKGLAIAGIVLYHAMTFVHGLPPFDHPKESWLPLADRLSQLQPIPADSVLSAVVVNAARYAGWIGYQGVNVFLVLSGFGLTWSLARRPGPDRLDLRRFFGRRLRRVFPVYWAGHAFFLVFNALTGLPVISTSHPHFYFSLAGARFLPATFFYISPAWWYVGLILQLYLLFPALWEWLRRRGVRHFWIGTLALTLTARFVVLVLNDHDLEVWSMGAIGVTRLFEFAFGMGIAFWLAERPDGLERIARRRWSFVAAMAGYAVGLASSFTRAGQVVAQSMLAVSLFWIGWVVSRGVLTRLRWTGRVAIWLGRQSYPLMILHQPLVWWFLLWITPTSLSPMLFLAALSGYLVVLTIGSAGFGAGVERVTKAVVGVRQRAATS